MTTIRIVTVSSKTHSSGDAKTRDESLMRPYIHSVSPHKILIIYSGENGRHHLNQVTEVTIMRNQTNRNHLSPNTMHCEWQHHFWSIPVKSLLLESNNEKNRRQAQTWGAFSKVNGLYSEKILRSQKTKFVGSFPD